MSENELLVSVVMPCLNEAETVSRCVGAAPNNYREQKKESLRKVPGCFILMFGLKPGA